jgi:hypothetical protein
MWTGARKKRYFRAFLFRLHHFKPQTYPFLQCLQLEICQITYFQGLGYVHDVIELEGQINLET